MSGFYDDMASLAVELLGEFGGPATLNKPAVTIFDKKTGEQTVVSPATSLFVTTVVGPIEVTDDQGRQLFKTIATLLVEAAEGDTITQGVMTYRVGKVTTVAPIGTPIVYLAEVL
ncbi:hypothetical protein [Sphingomonas oryzagri]